MKNFIKRKIKKIINKFGYDIIKSQLNQSFSPNCFINEGKNTVEINLKYKEKMMPCKKEVIDYVINNFNISKIAELGCVWGVEGVYGRYIAENYPLIKIKMVDTHWTTEAKKLCSKYSNIKIFSDNFGNAELPAKIGKISAVILFEVLLHQVAPDWDRILQMYSQYTDFFIIVNPQFIGSPVSVRLLDLGYDDYFMNVPHDKAHSTYKNLFEKMYQIHPDHNKIWRDVHHVWQWGITDNDLIHKMHELGFKLIYLKHDGIWYNQKNWENNVFVFRKITK